MCRLRFNDSDKLAIRLLSKTWYLRNKRAAYDTFFTQSLLRWKRYTVTLSPDHIVAGANNRDIDKRPAVNWSDYATLMSGEHILWS